MTSQIGHRPSGAFSPGLLRSCSWTHYLLEIIVMIWLIGTDGASDEPGQIVVATPARPVARALLEPNSGK
jgi:hypothetical protein